MKKLTLFLCVFALLSFIASDALPQINLTQYSYNLNVKKGIQSSFQLNITNYGDMTAYNITFTPIPDFGFPQITILEPNGSIIVNFTVTANSIGSSTPTTTLQYLYALNETIPPGTKYVNITASGFQPQIVQIKAGDLVRVTNLDPSSNHTITSVESGLFDGFIIPSDYYEFNPTSVMAINQSQALFYDRERLNNSAFVGRIDIIDRMNNLFAHASSLDKTLIFSVSSSYADANWNIIIYKTNFTNNPGEKQEGVMEIQNIGDKTIYNIHLSGTWMNFTQNDFNLTVSNNKIITFSVTPAINRTIDTNQSYIKKLRATADNSPDFSQDISIFVNYKQFEAVDIGNTTIVLNELSIDDTISFCLARPDYPSCVKLKRFCLDQPDDAVCQELLKAQVIEVDKPVPFSPTDVQAMIESNKYEGNVMQRLENKYNPLFSDIGTLKDSLFLTNTYILNLTQRQENLEKQYEEDKRNELIWTWVKRIGWFFLFLAIGGFFVGRYTIHRKFELMRIRS